MAAIGIDGGGTRTTGTIANLEGRILAVIEGESTNYQEVGEEKTGKILARLVSDLLEKAEVKPGDLKSVCLGLAGVSRLEDRRVIQDLLKPLNLTIEPLIVNDALIALVVGTLSDTGILMIAGTGSIVLGKGSDGEIRRAGGYGPLLSDEGSGYALGREALRAVMQAHDGRIHPTLITEKVLRQLNLKQVEGLVRWSTTYGREKARVAEVAAALFEAFDGGDEAATEIIYTAAADLAEMIFRVFQQCDFTGTTDIVLTGGVVDNQPAYFERIAENVRAQIVNCEIIRPRMKPVVGALLYALAQAGVGVSGSVLANLMRSWGEVAGR